MGSNLVFPAFIEAYFQDGGVVEAIVRCAADFGVIVVVVADN
jgi:hypothetical protein